MYRIGVSSVTVVYPTQLALIAQHKDNVLVTLQDCSIDVACTKLDAMEDTTADADTFARNEKGPLLR
jgi:hypothetical protein